MNLISEGCPINKLYWSMSNKFYRRVVQQINYIRVCPLKFIGVCPINYIGGLSNKFYWSMSNKLYRRLTNEFSKTKIFCFENSFSYMENACVTESARTRDMGHEM